MVLLWTRGTTALKGRNRLATGRLLPMDVHEWPLNQKSCVRSVQGLHGRPLIITQYVLSWFSSSTSWRIGRQPDIRSLKGSRVLEQLNERLTAFLLASQPYC